jgi:hypothetical protein
MHFAPTLGLQALSQSQGLPRILSHPVRVELRSQREQWGARADKRMHWMGVSGARNGQNASDAFLGYLGFGKRRSWYAHFPLLARELQLVRKVL